MDFTNTMSQRTIYRHVREALRILSDPTNAVTAPAVFNQQAGVLHQLFQAVAEQQIFSPFVAHNLGVKKLAFLREHYQEWQKTTERSTA